MRVAWLLVAVLAAASGSGVQAQLSVGPNGLSTSPINLVSVFRFIRDIVMFYLYPPEAAEADIQRREGEDELQQTDVTDRVAVMGFDTDGNIVEKFDSWCKEDENGNCLEREDYESTTPVFIQGEGVVEDKDGTTQLVVGKWPLIYITLISILFWFIVVIGAPYVLTGQTYGRREDDFDANSLVDQQDVLLLLSWLLGEASNDTSCLERVVCLTPSKSSKYIAVSSMIFNVLNFLQRWVPYSPRFEDLLHRLDEVAQDGYAQDCQRYYCPTIPEL